MTVANILIGVGLVAIAFGLAGLVWCINLAREVKTMDPRRVDLQAAFMKISAVNTASMGGAFLGLALVLAGLIL